MFRKYTVTWRRKQYKLTNTLDMHETLIKLANQLGVPPQDVSLIRGVTDENLPDWNIDGPGGDYNYYTTSGKMVKYSEAQMKVIWELTGPEIDDILTRLETLIAHHKEHHVMTVIANDEIDMMPKESRPPRIPEHPE